MSDKTDKKDEKEKTVEIKYAALGELFLDDKNPRLGRSSGSESLSQAEIYEQMKYWSLEVLAGSFLESGFWPQDAVLCVREELEGERRLVVVDGNRRVAALKRLKNAFEQREEQPKWQDLLQGASKPEKIFQAVPYIEFDSRAEADECLGFRHSTGIKHWAPKEKAQYIAKLIEERGMSYREVMRKIGSKTEFVARNFIAFRIFKQMEDLEGFDKERVEWRFSVLFLSVRSKNVQDFLGFQINVDQDPKEALQPIAKDKLSNLADYARWLFGDRENEPIVTDSRYVDLFASVLGSSKAVEYLRRSPNPNLKRAHIISGGERDELIGLVSNAAYSLRDALPFIHLRKHDEAFKETAKRLVARAEQIRSTLGLERGS